MIPLTTRHPWHHELDDHLVSFEGAWHRSDRRPLFEFALEWSTHMSEKATFAVFETSSGAKIHRLPLEAFPNFWAYVYLVQKDEYCILIDTGSGTDTSHENLVAGLEQAGLRPFGAIRQAFRLNSHPFDARYYRSFRWTLKTPHYQPRLESMNWICRCHTTSPDWR